jgi:hypothetical protein
MGFKDVQLEHCQGIVAYFAFVEGSAMFRVLKRLGETTATVY